VAVRRPKEAAANRARIREIAMDEVLAGISLMAKANRIENRAWQSKVGM
jgi:hypothetical protein